MASLLEVALALGSEATPKPRVVSQDCPPSIVPSTSERASTSKVLMNRTIRSAGSARRYDASDTTDSISHLKDLTARMVALLHVRRGAHPSSTVASTTCAGPIG